VAEAHTVWENSEAACENYEQQRLDIGDFRQSLLQKAFAGKLTTGHAEQAASAVGL
jgi:hypothetical protein